jgi:hypothetical protein
MTWQPATAWLACRRGTHMNQTIARAFLAAGLLLASAASAEIAMFSQRGFQGARYGLSKESGNMSFSPRSVRVTADQPWDICPRPFFGGACMTISQSSDNLNLPRAFSGMVRSARPSKGRPAAEPEKSAARTG